MKIETKFNIYDKLWFIDGTGIVIEVIIVNIDIKVSGNINSALEPNTAIEYRIRPTSKSSYTYTCIKENKLYKTKQEAGEAWLKSQGLKCGIMDN